MLFGEGLQQEPEQEEEPQSAGAPLTKGLDTAREICAKARSSFKAILQEPLSAKPGFCYDVSGFGLTSRKP